ncbi:hypothetical protein WR25_22369 isoform D [Diploscapter pachys]|uniref:Cation-transporting P-type ATPase N-terminal domain-containing protein n=1 Tax=Diploscapter pachys TaxID=2018661 RepID=A0A2A2KCI2_9BILA|nr:hypothetical protein WR25_22369 isoform B [Diploscapter pachys]PAV71602.1 hypothetical protein WR25_22369 isoform D [Diploscapter pachys]
MTTANTSSITDSGRRTPPLFKRIFSRNKVSSKDAEKGTQLDSLFSEHTWDIEKLEQNFPDSNIAVDKPDKSKGLSQEKADELLRINGPNILPKQKEMSDLELFIRQFLNILWILLIVAALLTLVSYFTMDDIISLWVAILLFVLIFVMCTVSWYQEREARKVIRGFENLLPEICNVIRGGIEKQVQAADIVVGDIIKIQSGLRVPADARIIDCAQLKLETSSITGEAEPLDYHPHSVTPNIPIFESHNVAFNSSLCVDGEGMGVVIRTGVNTVIGQIAALTTGQPTKKSHLEKQIKIFVHFLLILAPAVGTISMIVGGLTFGWGNWILLLSTSYAVCAIALVPEGLSATVTSILTVVARRLEKKSVYLKRLDIAEALGSANIIASDKTGTLTKNVMTVTDMWIDDLVIHGFPRLDDHTLRDLKTLETFKPPISDILLAMAVCNKADFDYDKDVKIDINEQFTMTLNKRPASVAARARLSSQDGISRTTHRSIDKTILPFSSFASFLKYRTLVSKRPALGAASDVAMLKYAAQVIDVGKNRRINPVVFEIPFNSKRKWQLVVIKKHKLADGQAKYKLIMKGASDILIKKCDKIMNMNEEEVPLDENERAKFERAVETFGEQGRRVIGFAQVEFVAADNFVFNEKEGNYPQEGLAFLGTCAIMDPPRDETADAIKSCKDAGIRIFMVTGDHHTTAKAIAEQIGLIDDKPANQSNWEIVKGEDIPKLTHRDWDRLAARNSLVFSRTTPEQKLLIVEEMQKRKQVIAMTGDGVNDSPALKKADIGVGMGSGKADT